MWALLVVQAGCDKSEWDAGGGGGQRREWDGPVQENPEPPPPAQEVPPAKGGEVTLDATALGSGGAVPAEGGGAVPGGEPPAGAGQPGSGEAFEGGVPMGSPPLPEGVKGVTLRGTVEFAGYQKGLIQIDVMDSISKGPSAKNHPQILRLHRMEKPGTFEIQVVAGQGPVYLNAYNDANQDGAPSRDEPSGTCAQNPVEVKDGDIEGLQIILKKEVIPPPPGRF